ncbi:phage portal protein [Bartonella sp. CB60]|uniref:phage portal protein n=1 Tax=Bartonella sp. CB60 TaxID=3113619 RepID=UPI00300DE479
MAFFLNKFNPFAKQSNDQEARLRAGSHGERLSGLETPQEHLNRVIEAAGATVVARSRWLYDNDPIYSSAVDEWVSAAVGDGVKPSPRIQGFTKYTDRLNNLWWQWCDRADYRRNYDFYGIQEEVAREVFLTGECFIHLLMVPQDEIDSDQSAFDYVPLKLEVLACEMLDVEYDCPAEESGNYIRMGIEFNQKGHRVAYHFFKEHPYDETGIFKLNFNSNERVRIPANHIIHIKEMRQSGQLRGIPRVTRVLTKIFNLDFYDEAELERKKTAALLAGFLVGPSHDAVSPFSDAARKEKGEKHEKSTPNWKPGLIIDVGADRDIKFSNPAEVGGSYDAFQYCNLLKICGGLGVPYSVVTGDVTRGNFSNVRTSIIQFRRRVGQWRANVLIFQLNRIVWERFVLLAQMANVINLPNFYENPTPWLQSESHAPPLEMIDPSKDMAANETALRLGLTSRRKLLSEQGMDISDIDSQIASDRANEHRLGLDFSPHMPTASTSPVSDNNQEDDEKSKGNEKLKDTGDKDD